MAKDSDSLIPQHQRMAMGMDGAKMSLGSVEGGGAHVPHMDARGDTDGRELGDRGRSARPPIRAGRRKLHNAAHSDHGPHHMNSSHKPVKLGGRKY